MPSGLSEAKEKLLGKLMSGGTTVSVKRPGIPQRPPGIDIPMSYAQQQIWLHSQFSTQVPIYNEPVTIRRSGSMDRAALERAFTEIVRRHEAWRTTFGWKGNELVQLVQSPPSHLEIPYLDVSALLANTREEAALAAAMEDALVPFDLGTGPLYRLRLIRFSEAEHRLYLTLHHIIFDGLSLYRIFLPELQVLYEAFTRNQASPLPPLSLQYGDFALWQRGWVPEVLATQLEYWRAKLAGAAQNDILKVDRPRAEIQSYRGKMVKVALDRAASDALKAVSQELQVTPFMALLATFYILLWTHSQEADLTVGVSSAGRRRPELEQIMGYFLDTVVLRADLAGDPSFADISMQCKNELFGALTNDAVPFSLMVKELSTGRDSSRHPFFQVMMSLEPPLPPLKDGWEFNRMDIHTGSTKFDLNLELDECPHGIEGRFIYNQDLFEQSSIERMVEDWYSIVAQVVGDPSLRISQLMANLVVAAKEELADPASTPVADTERKQSGLLGSFRRMLSRR